MVSGTHGSQVQVPGVKHAAAEPRASLQLSVVQHAAWLVHADPSVAHVVQVVLALLQVSPKQQLAGVPQPWSR